MSFRLITGTLWIGSVASTADGAEAEVTELRADLKQVPTDVAVLKVNVSDLKQTISDMRQEQKERDAAHHVQDRLAVQAVAGFE